MVFSTVLCKAASKGTPPPQEATPSHSRNKKSGRCIQPSLAYWIHSFMSAFVFLPCVDLQQIFCRTINHNNQPSFRVSEMEPGNSKEPEAEQERAQLPQVRLAASAARRQKKHKGRQWGTLEPFHSLIVQFPELILYWNRLFPKTPVYIINNAHMKI